MWVWISIATALVVASIIFAVAAVRAWRQVKALKVSVTAVQADLESYSDRLQIVGSGDREN